jgi:hypothetical protein
MCLCHSGFTGAGDFVFGRINDACNVHVLSVQILYGISLACHVLVFPYAVRFAVATARTSQYWPLGPITVAVCVFAVLTAALRISDPVGRTIGNDPLTTVGYALYSVCVFRLDFWILGIFVQHAATQVYDVAGLSMSHLADRLRRVYLPMGMVYAVLIANVLLLCFLASASTLATQLLTAFMFVGFAAVGIFLFVLLVVFFRALLKALDQASAIVADSSEQNEFLRKLRRTRREFSRSRIIYLNVLANQVFIAFVMCWPEAQAQLSYLLPWGWSCNILAFAHTLRMYWPSKARDGPFSVTQQTSSTSPTHDVPPSLKVVGGSLSTVAEGGIA